MSRHFNRPQRVFFVAMAIIIALAFAPSRWLGWTRDIARIVNVPFTPFGHAGVSVATWLRPPTDRTGASSDVERSLLEQRDIYERLYRAEQLRVAELEEQITQLQQVPPEILGVPIQRMVASITRRDARGPWASVQLNRGARHGVTVGTVAVYGGDHLLGRITDVSPLASELLPLGAYPDVRGIILPRDMPAASAASAPRVLLTPRADGTLVGHVEHIHPVAQGDVVRLSDTAWPVSASASVIGVVESVSRNDSQPLKNTIIVRPRYQVNELASVTLRVEIPGGSERGASR